MGRDGDAHWAERLEEPDVSNSRTIKFHTRRSINESTETFGSCEYAATAVGFHRSADRRYHQLGTNPILRGAGFR
jgi:hypothetical protein